MAPQGPALRAPPLELPSSPTVKHPVAGFAAVIGAQLRGTPSDYNTAVVIYDPKSRLVAALLHVRPDASLSQSVEPKWVKLGDPVGELAVPPGIRPLRVEEFRHVHVMVIDGSRREPRLLSPIRSGATPLLRWGDATRQPAGRRTAGATNLRLKDGERELNISAGAPVVMGLNKPGPAAGAQRQGGVEIRHRG